MPAERPCGVQTSEWPRKCSNNASAFLFSQKTLNFPANSEHFKYLYIVKFFMTRVFARSLSRKKIMSNDGKLIGTLKNIRVDFDSGQIIGMLVHPDSSFDTASYEMEDDKIVKIPFEAVKDIKDYIVVDRYLARK